MKRNSILGELREEYGFIALGHAIEMADWTRYGAYPVGTAENGEDKVCTERPEAPKPFICWLCTKEGRTALRMAIWKKIPHKHIYEAAEEGGSAETCPHWDSWCTKCGKHHRTWM